MGVVFDGNVDEGLSNINKINPNTFFDILYNKINHMEKEKVVSSILAPFNENNKDSLMEELLGLDNYVVY